MSRKFEAGVEISANAEAVWKAIAEAEGVQSWFAPGARVTPGVGGEIWVSWGEGMEGASKIEIWEPGRHLRYSHERPGAAEPNVVDFTIETREGGTTTLRLVNSGFSSDASFDGEFESTSRAWPLFLVLLKEFAERNGTCTNVTRLTMSPRTREEAWARLTPALAEIDGDLKYQGATGYACYELHQPNRPLLGVFCEACGGSTSLTTMCLLYDTKPGQEEMARRLVESLAATIS